MRKVKFELSAAARAAALAAARAAAWPAARAVATRSNRHQRKRRQRRQDVAAAIARAPALSTDARLELFKQLVKQMHPDKNLQPATQPANELLLLLLNHREKFLAGQPIRIG